MTVSGDVSLMGEALLEEAREEAARLLERARKDAAAVMESAEQEAERMTAEAITAAEAEGGQEARRRVAAAELESARIISLAREEMIGKGFDRLRALLRTMPLDDPDYSTVLDNLVTEAAEGLAQEEIVLRLRPDDLHLVDAAWLNRLCARLCLTIRVFEDPAHIEGGVIVSAADGRLRFDQSFEALVSRHEEVLRAIMAQCLWETPTFHFV